MPHFLRNCLPVLLAGSLLAGQLSFAQVGPGGVRGIPPGVGGSNIGGRPPTMPGHPGGGIAGGPGGGAIGGGMGPNGFGPQVTSWRCPNCKREVGRGTFPPAMVTCCGTTFVNGKHLGSTFDPPPPVTNPDPAVPIAPPIAPPTEPPPPEVVVPAPSPTSTPAPQPSSGETNGTLFLLLGIGIIVVGLMILGGIVLLAMQNSRRGAPPPRRRRRHD